MYTIQQKRKQKTEANKPKYPTVKAQWCEMTGIHGRTNTPTPPIHFSHLLEWKLLHFGSNFTGFSFWGSNYTISQHLFRWWLGVEQQTGWINDGPLHWHIHASLCLHKFIILTSLTGTHYQWKSLSSTPNRCIRVTNYQLTFKGHTCVCVHQSSQAVEHT